VAENVPHNGADCSAATTLAQRARRRLTMPVSRQSDADSADTSAGSGRSARRVHSREWGLVLRLFGSWHYRADFDLHDTGSDDGGLSARASWSHRRQQSFSAGPAFLRGAREP
jgi:hypothetical protein